VSAEIVRGFDLLGGFSEPLSLVELCQGVTLSAAWGARVARFPNGARRISIGTPIASGIDMRRFQ